MFFGKLYFCPVKIHQKYISRCIEIARNGLGTTAPNPMVGALLLYDGKIIGEGFTSAYGGSHAEVNAIDEVTDKSLLKQATLYVTLEPCAHHGKTPPCVDMILKNGIKKVVIGLLDPHEKVAGKGIQKLKSAGCEVTVGVLEKECHEHHKRFLTFHEKKRPYVILKWAETKDGFIAPDSKLRAKNAEPFWITSELSRQLVHQWRAEEQSILVGTNTVVEDNPKLDVRHVVGKNPTRIVIDRQLRIPANAHVFDGSSKTLVLTEISESEKYHPNAHYEIIDFQKEVAQNILKVLFKNNLTSVIIEGGAETLQTFINVGLWDEARIFKGNSAFGSGIKAPSLKGHKIASHFIGADELKIFTP